VRTGQGYVGQYTERLEDERLLTGRAHFVDDIHLEGMLHAVVVRSPLAHGLIRGIETTRALEMPGVHAVFTAGEISASRDGVIPMVPVRLASIPELAPYRQPVIANGVVRYVGEPLAVIIADSVALGEDAAAMVGLDIEQLPVVGNWQVAASGQALLFPKQGTNCAVTYTATKGQATATGPYVRRHTFSVQRHSAQPIETRGLVADWDSASGRMVVYGATKVPFFNRATLAEALGLPNESVDMIEVDVGGGFGVRGEYYPEDFLVPYASRQLGRPVKWIEDRLECLLGSNHSREMVAELEIFCERDGRIIALFGNIRVDLGAYVRTSGPVPPRNVSQFLSGPYDIPNINVRTDAFLTNKGPIGSYRGPGRFEADFFRERLFDIVARELDIDPVEFRRINLVKQGQMPYPLALLDKPSRAEELDSGNYLETLDRCLLEFDWDSKQALQGRMVGGKYHGVAVGCFVEGGGAGTKETARIAIARDGLIDLTVGSVNLGQGMVTVMSQIAADALHVSLDRIRVKHGSTTLLEEGYGSHHSRSTIMGGSAVLAVTGALKDEILSKAASFWQCPQDEIELGSGLELSWGNQTLSSVDLGQMGIQVDGEFASKTNTYAYGAAAAHVAVDIETGRVEVLDYFTVEDIGRIVNPLTAKGQAVGAVVQGLGGVFLEHLAYDQDGQSLTGNLAEYLMPTATDFCRIRAMELENYPSLLNPLGAKGAGEGGIIPVGGVVANAVAAALSSLGVQPDALPLTPCNVWTLIQSAGNRTASHQVPATLAGARSLEGEALISLPITQVWKALNDPQVLQLCIPGCEKITQDSETSYTITLMAAVGPVKMRMVGKLGIFDLNPPNSYSLAFEGSGGIAGSAKGTAAVQLVPQVSGTRLTYLVSVQISGKLAQVGSRLIDGVARQTAKEFFRRLDRVLGASPQDDQMATAGRAGWRALAQMPIKWILAALGVLALTAYFYYR